MRRRAALAPARDPRILEHAAPADSGYARSAARHRDGGRSGAGLAGRPERAAAAARPRHRQRLHPVGVAARSEEHTSELQSLMRISYAVFCLKKKKNIFTNQQSKK